VRSVLRVFLTGLILAMLGTSAALAQSTFDFSLFVTVNGNSGTVGNGGTVPITGQVGSNTTGTVVATYLGATEATVSNPTILGSAALKVSVPGNVTFPLILNPGQALTFVVTYSPTNANIANAQVEVPYTEPGKTGTLTNAILLQFTGAAPQFTLGYVLTSDNNFVQIQPNGTIPFPPTQLNTTATGELNISDTGSGPGTITNVVLAPSTVFKLSGTPPFPYTISASNPTLPIGILYTPTAVENDTGQITITYQDGSTAIVNLTGSGSSSSYTYTYLSGTGAKPTSVKTGGTITFLSANAPTAGAPAGTSSVIVQVTNSGNANGTINSINVTTGPFQLSGVPPNPPTLKPGDVENFTVTFTPTQVGTQTGTLVVGTDVFTLSGQGLGPQLTFSYVSTAGTIAVGTGGAVNFIPVAVSQSEKVTFIITNSGTLTATISNISTSAPFSLTPAPVLPLILAPGKSSQFGITFTPLTTATVTGTLQIDNTPVELLGSGTAPPALPSYTIAGPSGNVAPGSQPGVSLTLASSYPVDLNGVLTFTTSGSLGTDPNAQFSSGGRTVDFVIPAGSKSANFAGIGSQILLQTGTVAETITLAPTFATTAGVDVTPTSPRTLQFTVPSVAPFLVSAQIGNETSNSFQLVLVGYSTTRSLSSLNVTFNPAAGFNIGTAQLTVDLSGVSTAWFQSSPSLEFGGQFQITELFTLQGTPPKGDTLLQSIASVTATVSNGIGTSSSLEANVQ
jgi:hypothetical protein